MLSSKQIAAGKTTTKYSEPKPLHEHDDCIRMAYEWLDAQTKTKGHIRSALQLKHIIEKWAGRYISTSDVEVAANMHPEITGVYPYFNISSRLTIPRFNRLDGISEANAQDYRRNFDATVYSRIEK